MVPKALYRLGHVSRPIALCGVCVCVLQQCPEGHAMVPKALYRLGHVSRPLALCGVWCVCVWCVCAAAMP